MNTLLSTTKLTPILPTYIDATMMSCFRACPRKFYLEFVLGVRPPGLSIDLHAGACFASALEETYNQIYIHKKSLSQALEVSYARFLIEWGEFEIPDWKRTSKTKDRVWEAVVGGLGLDDRGYFQEYPPETDDIRPFIAADGKPTLEYTFAIPLEPAFPSGDAEEATGFPLHPSGQPFLYTGRFDMLGQKPDGKPIPRDEKTSGVSPGSEWVRKWQLRSQFMGYVWACQQCGLDVDAVCVRGVSILKTSIRQVQHEQPYPKALLDRWYDQLRRDLWRIRRAWDEGHWDFNFAESCTSYGNCIFMDSCTSHQPELWLSDMEVRRWNPLHKNPVSVPVPGEVSAS